MKINIGCGKEIKEGFVGLDIIDFGQMYVQDVREKWPVEDGSIKEVYSRHLLPCLTKPEINQFFNELYRVLEDGATAMLIIPAWNANGGYGHPHFISEIREGYFFFLSKEWRKINAPEVTDLECDFDAAPFGYNMNPYLTTKHLTYQQFALSNLNNSAIDIIITLKKKASA